MQYKELEKILYQSEEEYKLEYQKRFTFDSSIHMDFMIGKNQAFFVQCDEVIRLMFSVLRDDKKIQELCSMLPGIAKTQYQRKCLIDEIVLTNNIEGVHSSRKEIGDALSTLETQSKKKKHQRFEGIVNKYLKLSTAETIPLNTCQDIRHIYDEIVLEEVVSENKGNAPDGIIFRKDSATVYNKAGKMIHVGIGPEERIIQYMENLLAFLNDNSIEYLYRICLFHYFFEYIHPFYDGNGRLGRFILSYSISQGLEPLLAYRISETIKENITDYYKAFNTCNNNRNLGDTTPFLIMMLSMIYKAEEDLIVSLREKLALWNRYEQHAIKKYPDLDKKLLSVLIQASLFSETGISRTELEDFMKLSYLTLKKRLDAFKQLNLLVENKKGIQKFYELNLQTLNESMIAAD